MKKILTLLFVFTLMLQTSAVFAHVTNEKTLYDDIQFSKAKEEIVYLRGIEVIGYEHGVNLFKPQDKLTKADLAFWAASFKGLGGEESTKADLQKAAIANGLVDSLEGNATYGDVSNAYLDGKATAGKPESELTKEEFALFVGQFLKEKVDGKTLFDMAGAEPGPHGVIEKVTVKEEGQGEKATKIYWFTIGGDKYKVSPHPKMLYGPVDLSLWEGKKVKDSWLMKGHGEEQVLQIVALEQGQFVNETANPDLDSKSNQHGSQDQKHTSNDNTDSEQPQNGFPVVPVVGGLVLVMIIAWLFMKKRK